MKLRLDMVKKEKLETKNAWGKDENGEYITVHDTNGKFVQKLYYD